MTNRRNENDGMGLSALWVLVFAACLALLLGMMVSDARSAPGVVNVIRTP